MNKRLREDFKVLQAIFKNAKNKKQKCLICEENSINSHLLQKNGILNLISTNSHITQIKGNDFFKAEKDGIISIKSIGINNAMSYPLFCNSHDTDIFAPIEIEEHNLNDYNSQLLFSYRSLCAEIRKKIINVDIFKRVNNSRQFAINTQFIDMAKSQVEANTMGIQDLNWYKNIMELEINNSNNNQDFIFEKIDFDFIPISASAVYTPINPEEHTLGFLKKSENILNYIFINLIPQKDKLSLIIGYHKSKSSKWILEYISSWKKLTQLDFELKLTDLFATKIETWAISPDFWKELKPENIKAFKEYWNKNANNLRITQNVNFNLFG
ncbi:hypothetical protein [Tenacibaculum singaporense]|uniref:Uncharacterized protein n=1 Tax=Tenacibaculum singaporense TaxID=2358479 RepID=A0A3Q8RSR4_9FLAO|nr:hypothetical protein [Tenacibaculum singaporense]AZJ36648.1 hypothetical protein D6T69_14345 [Tenacibaculum singaporense]